MVYLPKIEKVMLENDVCYLFGIDISLIQKIKREIKKKEQLF